MYLWWTEYPINDELRSGVMGAKYGSYVIAKNRRVAKNLLKRRNLGEEITSSPGRPIKNRRIKSVAALYKARKLEECLHTICFVGISIINAKLIKPEFLLKDNGIIHEIVHELQFPDEFRFHKSVYEKLKKFDILVQKVGY